MLTHSATRPATHSAKPLRPYQQEAVDRSRELVSTGVHRFIFSAPTGAGKTRLAREIIDRAAARGSRVTFVAPRKELIEQTSRDLDSAGIDHGVIQASHWRRRPWLPVQIASVATLVRRSVTPPDIMFLDECHLWLDCARKLVALFPDAIVIGLTATPARLDGRGLGEIYQSIITVSTPRDLITAGFLVPYRVFAPSDPNLVGVRTTAGDYNRKDLTGVMDTPKIVGDVVATWQRLAAGRSTIVFAVSVEASKRLAEAFRDAGVSAEHVDAETSDAQRQSVVQRLGDGRLTVACNVELFTYGLDVPRVSCISMARPTKSLALYLQMTGRGLRPAPGKTELTLLDHAGNTLRHGFPDEPRTWTLSGVSKRNGQKVPGLRTCTQCFAISPAGSPVCGVCGITFPWQSREVKRIAGELVEHSPPADRWRALNDSGRTAALAKWIRTKSRHQAIAIYRSVFKSAPDSVTIERAQEMANA